jgi:hypothetical protein
MAVIRGMIGVRRCGPMTGKALHWNRNKASLGDCKKS